MNYEELDATTRDYMLSEFEIEEAGGNPYRSKALSPRGLAAFPDLMRGALRSGTEISLCKALQDDDLWDPNEEYTIKEVLRKRQRNIPQAAQRLALTEFSTWYVRGLAKRLIEEGVEKCQIYRGEKPKWEAGECNSHDGLVVSVRDIYENHRARYWPEPGDKTAFSIPWGPGCHHVIRRAR